MKDVSEAKEQGYDISHESILKASEVIKEPLIEILKPSEFRNWKIPKGFVLVGDCHITRGNWTVLGGYPGVGKSRAVVGLAVAGATGKSWMGLDVKSKFKTLVLQVENGDVRLKQEFEDIGNPDGVDLDDWLGVSRIPVHGLDFQNEAFRNEVKELIGKFKPGVLAIDAWNRVADDDKAKDYKHALDAINKCLPNEPSERPAVLIVHHMRKKGSKHSNREGNDLIHELSGSYCIGSAARSVFILESASTDTTDDRLVFTCCKCNDGEAGPRTAWHRRNGLFAPCPDFEWDEFGQPELNQRTITMDDMRRAVGVSGVSKAQVARTLMSETGKGKSTVYRTIQTYSGNLTEDTAGLLYWRSYTESPTQSHSGTD
jgi:hypothetical protein